MLIQQLVSETSVKAFDAPVLHRAAGFDEMEIDAVIRGPKQHLVAGKFSTVIGFDRFGKTSNFCKLRENSSNSLAGKREIDFDSDALSAEIIDDGQSTKSPASAQRVVDEIDRPPLVWPRYGRNSVASEITNTAFTASTDLQAMYAIYAVDSFVIHDESVAS